MKDLIHFAHGNGFPSPCYNQLFKALDNHYDHCYIDKLGHNPDFPVTENWEYLVDEVIESIKKQAEKPVIGLGHSLGGVLTLLAAIKQPALFKAVIMIDSPLLGRLKSNMVRLAKMLGVIDYITPAYRTKGRRLRWKNKEQIMAYLKTRPLFKTFSRACLEDYAMFGLKQEGEHYHLVFNHHVEYLIFRTIPHNLHEYAGQLKVPSALIYGTNSTVVSQFDIRYMKQHFHIPCFKMKGTHMLPMETPEQLAEKIVQVLDVILL